MAEKSRLLLWSSILSLVCGATIIGLAAWNANEVAWSPLTNAIASVGGILMGVAFMGIMNSQGCTFCCNVLLYVYVWTMGALSLAGVAFVIAAGVKQSDWVERMARRYSDDESTENIDHLKEKYDKFMPFVIAFGVVTVFSCIVGFLSGWRYLGNLRRVDKVRHQIISEKIDRRTQAEREKVKRRHHETVVQMTEKYNLKRDPEGRLLQ